jgi:hypothetical protein
MVEGGRNSAEYHADLSYAQMPKEVVIRNLELFIARSTGAG